MKSIHTAMANSGLVRGDDRWVAGVCSGLARKFGTDPGLVRLIMVLLLVLPGSQLIIYPILWFVMPDAATAQALTAPATPPYLGPTYPGDGQSTGPQDRLH